MLGKATDYDSEHAYFRLARVLRNLRLARIIHDCRREALENVCRGSSGHIVLVEFMQLRPKAFGRENGKRIHRRVGFAAHREEEGKDEKDQRITVCDCAGAISYKLRECGVIN